MAISTKFRDLLPRPVAEEMDLFVAGLKRLILSEHEGDGSHGDITARTLSLSEHVVSTLSVPNQVISQVQISATQTIATATPTSIIWRIPVVMTAQAEAAFEPYKFLQPTTLGGITGTTFIPPEPGTYLITAQIQWDTAGATTGSRYLSLIVDGTEIAGVINDGTTKNITQTLTKVYVWPNAEKGMNGWKFNVFQNSGGNLDLTTTDSSGWAQAVKLW